MCPLNKTKKQHIFLAKKKLCICKQKSNTFFREKSVYCGLKKRKKRKKKKTN